MQNITPFDIGIVQSEISKRFAGLLNEFTLTEVPGNKIVVMVGIWRSKPLGITWKKVTTPINVRYVKKINKLHHLSYEIIISDLVSLKLRKHFKVELNEDTRNVVDVFLQRVSQPRQVEMISMKDVLSGKILTPGVRIDSEDAKAMSSAVMSILQSE